MAVLKKYQSSFEYIQDMLCRLDILLNIQTSKFQKIQSILYKDISSTVAITDEEINILLKKNSTKIDFDIYKSLEEEDEIKKLRCKLESKEREIIEKVKETQIKGLDNNESFLALPYLINTLNLNSLEIDAIIICLAVQIDSQITKKYERIYAYLNDNLSQKRPTVNLVLGLEYPSIIDRMKSRFVLSKDSKLFRYQILQFIENDGNYDVFERPIRIDEKMAGFLLGTYSHEPRISSFASVISPINKINSNNDLLVFEPDISQKINSLFNIICENNNDDEYENLKNNSDGNDVLHKGYNFNKQKIVLNLCGPKGSGRKSMARFFCNNLGYHLLMVDIAKMVLSQQGSEGEEGGGRAAGGQFQLLQMHIVESLYLSFREALFFKCPIYLANFDILLEKDKGKNDNDTTSTNSAIYPYFIQSIIKIVEELSWLTFIETNDPWSHDGAFNDCFFINVEFKIPGFKTRKMIWESIVKKECKTSSDDGNNGSSVHGCLHFDDTVDNDGNSFGSFDMIASKFVFTPGKIQDAFNFAKNIAMSKNFKNPVITMEDIYQSCKIHSNQRLSIMAKKIRPNYTWDDIVLPLSSINLLMDICNAVKHKTTVFSDWGFGSKFSIGKGLTALFTGESGTGKTMAAEVLAKELNLDLYKIDLSSILSKYIGETEKNLNTIFKESEGSNSILFFDEADALFGKRTEVKDSHDKYANIETNYLLQKIDEFEGMVILSTNLRRNIDDAFIRRMQFVVDFPFPKSEYRFEIWKKAFPNQMPKSDDIDFEFLANNLQISGGNIKNIVINSAFLAAKNGKPVCMQDLILATRREFEKIGRPIQRAGFGKYINFLEDFNL